MKNFLLIIQAILSVSFMLSVLLQEKGSAMSLTFGGTDNETFYGSKQGLEKFLAYSSYLLGTLFIANGILFIVIG